jgi:hypothetical protein
MCSTQDRSDPWQTKHKNTKTQNNMDRHPQWAPRPEILEQDCMHHRMGVEYCVGVLTEPEGGGGVATPRASYCCAPGELPVGCVLKTARVSESRHAKPLQWRVGWGWRPRNSACSPSRFNSGLARCPPFCYRPVSKRGATWLHHFGPTNACMQMARHAACRDGNASHQRTDPRDVSLVLRLH